MTSNTTYSLSLQKQIPKHSVTFDSLIDQAFNELNFRSLTKQSNLIKKRGFDTGSLLFLYVLLLFLKRVVSDFWNSQYLQNHVDARKDTFYRFLNHERFNWRKLVYAVALKIISRSKEVALKDKVLIADDTVSAKTGKKIERVSYHHDHKVKHSILGTQFLQLKKKTKLIDGQNLKGVCLNVTLPKTGLVRILFVSDGRKDWQALLCTDIDLESAKILQYYARRWSIELYFKDVKQWLCMGKDQSGTFDAQVAANSLVMIRYLLIVYMLSKRRIQGPIGPLFRQESDRQSFLIFAKAIWDNVKELIFKSSDILSYN